MLTKDTAAAAARATPVADRGLDESSSVNASADDSLAVLGLLPDGTTSEASAPKKEVCIYIRMLNIHMHAYV